MVHQEQLSRKQMAKQLDTTVDVVDAMYNAAAKRFSVRQLKCKPCTIVPVKPAIERPPAIYSNKKSLY